MAIKQEDQAFSVLPSSDLQADIAFYTRELHMQLHRVYPSEKPHSAELSGQGLSLLLDTRYDGSPGLLVMQTENPPRKSMHSPSGTELRWQSREEEAHVQSFVNHRAEICTLRGTPWVTGRAGTHSRDLIPSRLGGGIIASHIRIPNGGPVRDRVHYHTAGFQLLFCVQGWIELVYEDQGQSITLRAGDCVTQPPHIRHRVLETSNGLEVIEIGTPAEHVTAIDNDLQLPTGRVDSHRLFHGQRFCHFSLAGARWQPHRLPGLAAADTGINEATGGLAGVRMLKAMGASPAYRTAHEAEALFTYVVAGSVRINRQLMVAGDAFTLPPNEEYTIGDISGDVSLLEVSLPGVFNTRI
jgi:mannose-6-phosphate isomerase-like protein (cupin superfamily)